MGLVSAMARWFNIVQRIITDDSDQFVLMHFMSTLCVVRYCNPRSNFQSTLWQCFRLLLLGVYVTYCYKVYWHLTHWEFNASTATVLGSFWLFSGTLIRVILVNRPEQASLERFLNDRSFRQREPAVLASRRSLQKSNNRFLIGVAVGLVLEVCMFCFTDLIGKPEHMLEYEGRFIGGRTVQIIYGWLIALLGVQYVITFAMMYTVINMFRLEMSILVQAFASIGDCIKRYEHHLETEQEQQFWAELRRQLNTCIQRHVDILNSLAEFRYIMAPFAFVQYYGSFVVIAIHSFISLYYGPSKMALGYIGFIAMLVLESFLLCRSVGIVNELHCSIGRTLYEIDWPGNLRYSKRYAIDYRHVRQSLLIVMIRSLKALPFTISGQGTVTVARFTELMNSSYSLLTLMLQVMGQSESESIDSTPTNGANE